MELDLGILSHPAVWSTVSAGGAALLGFIGGRAGRDKTIAEAEKIRAETKKLLDEQSLVAENRLHDQILASFGKLAELYEKNLDAMKNTIDNMDREIAELRSENEALTRTVTELTRDKEQLRNTVEDLRRNIDRLIAVLRSSGQPVDPDVEPMLKGSNLPS